MVIKNVETRIYKGNILFSDIAKEAGVHRNTISRWFNDSEMNEVQKGIVKKAIDNVRKKAMNEYVLDLMEEQIANGNKNS